MIKSNQYYQCGLCGIIEDVGMWSERNKNHHDAEVIFEEAVSMAENCGKDKSCLLRRLKELAEIYTKTKKYSDAEEIYQQLLKALDERLSPTNITWIDYLKSYKHFLVVSNRSQEVKAIEERIKSIRSRLQEYVIQQSTDVDVERENASAIAPIGYPYPVKNGESVIAWARTKYEAERMQKALQAETKTAKPQDN